MFTLLIALSMLMSACAGAVATEVAQEAAPEVAQESAAEPRPTDKEVEPVAPTTAPVEPEPTVEPVDYRALFTELIAGLDPAKGYGTVSASKLTEELASTPAPTLVDVREVSEIEANGYIEGAVHIPIRDLLKNLDKLPGLDDPIVIYCASGHRGAFGMAALRLLGYTNVRNLGGGLGAWSKAGLPVETGAPAEAAVISTPIVENAALFTDLDAYLSGLPEGFYSIKADKVNENLAGTPAPVLIDVRSAEEVTKDGYIEDSMNIPLPEFMSSLDQLPADKNAPIVIYCASGHRGAVAAMALRFLGYSNVNNLAGGLGAWKTAQFPVVGWVDWMGAWKEFLTNLPADQGFYSIKADVLNTALVENPPFLLDVREPAELEADGFIEGAVNLPIRSLLQNLDKLPDLDDPIVVYCASGHRGGMGMAALRLLGYTNVTNLAGGLGAWKKAELPVATGAPVEPVAGTAPEVDATRLAGLDAYFSALPEGFSTVKAADLNSEIAGGNAPLIVDVRSAEDFAAGHIEGAINLPINDLFNMLDQLPDKSASIVVLCASGHRGGMAMMALGMNGYTAVRNLGGGMNAWVAAELPVVP
jgi:rhodanese-related sulfurtransferase